jgi:hypothetical protein
MGLGGHACHARGSCRRGRRPGRSQHLRPQRGPHASGALARGPRLRHRPAGQRVSAERAQPPGRGPAGGPFGGRGQRDHRPDCDPAAERLCARARARTGGEGLAQGPRAHGGLLFHVARGLVRGAHRPARQRRRDRRGAVPPQAARARSLQPDRAGAAAGRALAQARQRRGRCRGRGRAARRGGGAGRCVRGAARHRPRPARDLLRAQGGLRARHGRARGDGDRLLRQLLEPHRARHPLARRGALPA